MEQKSEYYQNHSSENSDDDVIKPAFHLAQLLKIPEVKTKTPRSEHAWLIGQFVEALNASRKGQEYVDKQGKKKKLKPLSAAFIASKMAQSGVRTNSDLYMFLGQCKEAKSFSSYWWWSLDAKNAKK